jgi:DNA-binding LacI/PurR family transcriptional regulator
VPGAPANVTLDVARASRLAYEHLAGLGHTAIGLLHVARGLSRDVPADLSIVAYDELPVAEYLSPPLTTVAMPLSELGAAAVEILVELLDGRPPRSEVPGSEPVLVERASTAAP